MFVLWIQLSCCQVSRLCLLALLFVKDITMLHVCKCTFRLVALVVRMSQILETTGGLYFCYKCNQMSYCCIHFLDNTKSAAVALIASLGSRLRAVGKHGGKTREFDCGMLILVAICTAMIGSTRALLVGSKRWVYQTCSCVTCHPCYKELQVLFPELCKTFNRYFFFHLLPQVCGVGDKRPDNLWLAAEGVYLPVIQRKQVCCKITSAIANNFG